jgi:cobalt/nickel transport system ATP-binding protein
LFENQYMEEILGVQKIHYSYFNSIPALVDVSLQIHQGKRFAIIGSNGSGKSTLLQILSGLIHPSSGKTFFKGQEVSESTLKDSRFQRFFRARVGYVFQDSDVQLFCPTVLDELLYGPIQLGLSEADAMERAEEIMGMLRIENLRNRPSTMLSGGEKKRVALGSILTMNPEVLLFDEPSNGLDPRTQVFLLELMLALNEAGKTIVVATHDLSLVGELESDVAVLSENHRLEKVGTADEILHDQELLLKVNLIHEHVHYHGSTRHSHIHSHYLFHQH